MRAILQEIRPVTDRDTLYVFDCPGIAAAARPGQFVEVKLTDTTDPYLRRPISIFDADGERWVSLLVRTVGKGTQAMTRWEPGREVDLLGPLGKGFSWAEEENNFLLVGGGIGLAPMGLLVRRLRQEGKTFRLLFTPKREEQLPAGLALFSGVEIAYACNRGEIPRRLEEQLTAPTDRVFACGPEGLLETVAATAAARGVASQVSMERRMGCGIGLCVGCAVAVRTEDGFVYRKACQDGPVFAGEEVLFHES